MSLRFNVELGAGGPTKHSFEGYVFIQLLRKMELIGWTTSKISNCALIFLILILTEDGKVVFIVYSFYSAYFNFLTFSCNCLPSSFLYSHEGIMLVQNISHRPPFNCAILQLLWINGNKDLLTLILHRLHFFLVTRNFLK